MYPILLAVHSLLRWVVLAAGGAAVLRALGGGRSWSAADDRAGLWFVVAMDLQFVLGLLLYVGVSPVTKVAFADFGGAMASSMLRFWAVEHLVGMLIAIALVHIGRVRIRKADVSRRRRLALVFYGLAMVVMLASIPWPGMPAARPLFRPF